MIFFTDLVNLLYGAGQLIGLCYIFLYFPNILLNHTFDWVEMIEYICILKNKYRGVEQLVARRAHNPKVVGSSPAPATKDL